MRTVNVETLTTNIKEMCIQANHYLAPDMAQAMKNAYEKETKPLAKQILGQLLENLDIAGKDPCPRAKHVPLRPEVGPDVPAHLRGRADVLKQVAQTLKPRLPRQLRPPVQVRVQHKARNRPRRVLRSGQVVGREVQVGALRVAGEQIVAELVVRPAGNQRRQADAPLRQPLEGRAVHGEGVAAAAHPVDDPPLLRPVAGS